MSSERIEDMYPLSPLQRGMLFHSIYAPESGVYVVQLSCLLHGPLNVPAFRQAWQRVVDRHPILRTAFVWVDLDEPVQVVCRGVGLPWQQQDWRGLSPAAQQQRLAECQQAERVRGFDPSEAPLMRLMLVRLADECYHFLWSHHHALLDGWSLPLILKEVFACYDAAVRGQEPSLEPSRPYRDYIAWLKQQDVSQAETFWRQRLQGFTAPTPLGVKRSSSALSPQAEDYGEQSLHLSATTTSALQALARQQQVTLNTIVQGAWALLLSRYSGQDDVVFGIVVSGRPAELPGVQAMIGPFINTLPMRVQLKPQMRLDQWLKELQAQQAEMRRYEYSPLMQVQSWSEVPPGTPLFDSLFAFENYPVEAVLQEQNGDLRVSEVRFIERTNYPLTVVAGPGRQMPLRVLYEGRWFEADTVRRLLGHLRVVLEGMVVDPHAPLWRVPLLTDDERQQILVQWNQRETMYSEVSCVHEVFAAQVAQRSEAVAVVCGEHHLSYGELNRRAGELACELRGMGVGPEARVGICLERSPELIISILGSVMAGGAYVPLDPASPDERLAFMLADCQAAVLLTQSAVAARLPQPQAQVVCLDQWLKQEAIGQRGERSMEQRDQVIVGHEDSRSRAPALQHPVGSQKVQVEPENLAYLIYTSGSTGTPKAVALEHRGLANLVRWHQHQYQVRPDDRATLVAGLGFDASVWELWPYLTAGASLHLPDEPTRFSPHQMVQWLTTEQITLSFLPTPLAEAVLAEPWPASVALRALLVGGDTLHHGPRPELPFPVVNHYGPTEYTVVATWTPVAAGTDQTPPIGRPIANTQVYLLDGQLQPVPVGVVGEVYIGGQGLARGYHGQPALTAERFIPNPFSRRPGERLYRTGDLARYRADGQIEFVGRADEQVKVRGFRLELGEIEAVLGQHPGVREAAVVVREDEPGQKQLVAYVVPSRGSGVRGQGSVQVDSETLIPDPETLIPQWRQFLRQKLPEYMVPSAFVLLEALPLTPNGKINRRALPKPDYARPDTEFIAPRTEVEETLAKIWAQVLRLERVGVHDNYFELGGDSILSIQIVARAQEAGLRLTPHQIFQYPTIAELAAVAGTGPAVETEQGVVTGVVPLTPIQQWFFEQQLVDPHYFNQAVLLRVRQHMDPSWLRQAVQQLLLQHDALRMRFVYGENGWQQINAGWDGIVPLTWIDVSALTQQQAAVEAAAEQVQASLNLSEGPLLRVVYFDLGAEAARLLIVIHHLVVDGVSWRILLQDLVRAYEQARRGEPVHLGRKTTSFKRWAERLRDYARSEALLNEVNYWLDQARAQVGRLPVDWPQGQNTVATTRSLVLGLEQEETRLLLQQVPQAYHTQINEVLLTALALALARWTGQRRVLVDVEGHGREGIFDDVDLTRTVGWLTTLYPVLLDVGSTTNPAVALKTIKEQVRAIPHHGLDYGVLRYLSDTDITEKLRSMPSAEVSFNYLGQFDQALPADSPFEAAPESSGAARSRRARRQYVLEVSGSIIGGRLQLLWMYSDQLHRRETIERVACGTLEALRAIIAHCQSPEAGGYTPSDFPEAEVSQKDLDMLLARIAQSGRG